jgi:DNA anti-recombination protein RmuC
LFEQKLGTFTSSYQDIGEALEKATSAYEDAGKRFEELKVNATKVGTALDEVELKDSPLLKESNEDLEIPSES